MQDHCSDIIANRAIGLPPLESRQLGPLTFWKIENLALRPRQTADVLPSGPHDLVKVLLQLEGQVEVECRGRTDLVEAGTWGVYGSSRPRAHVTQSLDCKQLIIVLPRRELASRSPGLGRVMYRQFPSGSITSALAFRFLTSLYDSVVEHGACGKEMANVAIHLLQVALSDQLDEENTRSGRDKARARILSHIDLHIHDPELSVESIAHTMRCSSRYLQKVFEGSEPLSRYIWRTRLERCRTALEDPQNADVSITAIAFSLGFSNASHFSRTFRAQFGVSASHFRSASRLLATH